MVIVAGQLLDQGDVARWLAEAPHQWAYVFCFLLVWFDAVVPIFPGETTLSAGKVKPHRDKALENPKVRVYGGALDRSPGLLIMAGRYVPEMRFVVNASMGPPEMPYRRFRP